MNQWTDAARRMLDECLNRNRTRFAAEGAEADEVAADLRRHLEYEASQERLKVVTVSDVRRLLARVDPNLMEPAEPRPEVASAPPPPSTPPTSNRPNPGRLGTSLLWFFSVLLPLGTLSVEYFTGICAAEFFNPIPTLLHVVLVALVPVANTAALLCLQRRTEPPPPWLWWLHAAGIGVAAGYSLVFLPLAPFGFLGLIFCGFGLLPLSPLLSLISGSVLQHRLKAQALDAGLRPTGLRWFGAGVAVLLMVAPMVPAYLTLGWMRDAADAQDPVTQTRAVQRLRQYGSEHQVLRAAYGQFTPGWMAFGGSRPCTPAQAQELYFRMTGRPYNAEPPPASPLRGQGRAMADEFEWDNNLGGESVAGRVTGLSLLSSRLDASAHAPDGWGYTEWTLEFRNDHPRRQREARALLQLPPGGVVSRVTLWINGEEREAAFAGRSAARAAYQEVAVEQRRDPILVTTAGPDRVLMQCFPIPPEGGVMKVRLGISAPLPALDAEARAFLWPRMVERNFAIHDEVRHHAWLELIRGAVEPAAGWIREAGRDTVIHAAIPEREFSSRLRSVRLNSGGTPGGTWAKDDRNSTSAWVRQQLQQSTVGTPGRLALVVDAGKGADAWVNALRETLETTPGGGELGVWMVHDGAHEVVAGGSREFREAAVPLKSWDQPFAGGHDPGDALAAAFDWAAARPDGTVLWLHGPLPVAGHDHTALRQRLDRNANGARLLELSALDGPNRLLERLDGVPGIEVLPRIESLQGDLRRFLQRWSGQSPEFRWAWSRTEQQPDGELSGSRHLVRLWAAHEVESMRRGRRSEEATKLATRWQLVTPVSGAVVLETREQFARHGLSPVDPLTAPTVVPEPSTWALLILGGTVFAWMGRNRRFRRNQPE